MIVGTLAGAGTLGLLIPPSITLIIYGVTVNESIAKLFIAGVLPGIMLALMFMGYVWSGRWPAAMAAASPKRAGYYLDREAPRRGPAAAGDSADPAVMGSIYLGLATATEAAVLGVVGGAGPLGRCRARSAGSPSSSRSWARPGPRP